MNSIRQRINYTRWLAFSLVRCLSLAVLLLPVVEWLAGGSVLPGWQVGVWLLLVASQTFPSAHLLPSPVQQAAGTRNNNTS